MSAAARAEYARQFQARFGLNAREAAEAVRDAEASGKLRGRRARWEAAQALAKRVVRAAGGGR